MPWVRFDDTFPTHRKVDGLSDAAFRLHVSAIFWCARNLTDGAVPEEDLDLVTARVRTPARFAADLVRRELWHESGHDCPDCPQPTDGWMIHGYLEFQPSKERVLAERRGSAERQRAWRDRHKPSPSNGSSNAVSNGGTNSAPSRPDPLESSSNSLPAADSGDFDEFWRTYPPRKNSSKSNARKAYTKAIKDGAEPSDIHAAAAAYATDRQGQDQQYTAHAATWLNQKRWETHNDPDHHTPAAPRPWWDN
jgi:hypothetical protein